MDNGKILEYEKFAFASLFILANKLQVVGDQFLEEITTKQWMLLVMVAQFEDQPPTLGQVAGLLGTSHQNTKQLALKLEKKGFLLIEKDSLDNRALRIKPTKKCMDYFIRSEDQGNQFLNDLYKDFSNEEIIALSKGIYKLYHGLSNMNASMGNEEFGWIKKLFT